MIVPESARAAYVAHAEACYPAECCGLLLTPKDGSGEPFYRAAENVQSSDPVEDPDAEIRGSETAFHLDGREIVRAQREKLTILAIVHSHPDHDAYFSAMDRAVATYSWEGEPPEPMFPGTQYAVISVRGGKAADERWYDWNGTTRDFEEIERP